MIKVEYQKMANFRFYLELQKIIEIGMEYFDRQNIDRSRFELKDLVYGYESKHRYIITKLLLLHRKSCYINANGKFYGNLFCS